MPGPAVNQEQGNLYPAEAKQYPKGQTGKGANVKLGSAHGPQPKLSQPPDKYAQNLKKTWNKATSAFTRFRSRIG